MSLFRSECKLILYLTTMYVYCIYSALSKSPKQLQNCLKIAETIIVLIVCAYTVTVYQISLINMYKDQLSRQTGSRNLTGPKTLPTYGIPI